MSNLRSICLFGGTFDPIHQGHLHIANLAQQALKFDKLLFLPCRKSPHKLDSQSAAEHHRLTMCRLAISGLPWADVDDHDLITPAPSYSWKTVEHFKQQHPSARLFWLMGTDQWNALHQWNRFEHLASMVEFVICTRGTDTLLDRPFTSHAITSSHPASSTKIRNAIASQTPPEWLHPDVAEHLEKNSLYLLHN